MKENLNEEIKRNIELMGLQVNETALQRLIKKAIDKVSDFFTDDDKDVEKITTSDDKDEDEEPEVNIDNLEKDSEEEKEFLDKIKSSLNIRDISPNSTCRCAKTRLPNTKYFIIHHTAGRGDCDSTMNTLNNRKNKKTGVKTPLGIQWIVDREGNVCQALPLNSMAYHILDSALGPNNLNSQGVEVSGMDDSDILPVQAVSVLKLIKKLGISPSQVYGHGEVNPGHKQATEGKTIKDFVQKNYNANEDDYDFSMFGDRQPDFSQM